jgi:hypothetical protein
MSASSKSDTTAVSLQEAQIGPLDPRHANRSWRIWLTRHPIAGALLSGFVATHIATIFGYWFPAIGLPQLNWPIVNGNVVVPGASPVAKFVIGEVFIHGLDGIVFTLIYAIVLFPLLSPVVGRRVNPLANMVKALIFCLVLATIAAGFLTPYAYAPHSGAGIFSTGFGWKTVFAIYLWHVAFGVNLGMMYNPILLSKEEINLADSSGDPAVMATSGD